MAFYNVLTKAAWPGGVRLVQSCFGLTGVNIMLQRTECVDDSTGETPIYCICNHSTHTICYGYDDGRSIVLASKQ